MKQRPLNFKTRLRTRVSLGLVATLLAASLLPIVAADEKTQNESKEDLATLQQLLKMPKEDLKRVRLTLESIEKMSPADRRKALQRIQDLNKMPSKERKETINRWNELSPDLKKSYFDHLRSLSAADRKKFQALPWDKQVEQVKKSKKK